MIKLTIANESGEKEIIIHAETMNELIDEKLPTWLPNIEDDLSFLRVKKPKDWVDKWEERERSTGWYYSGWRMSNKISDPSKSGVYSAGKII